MVVWFRQALPYPRSNPEEAGSPASAAGLFAHRWPGVGRMLGAPDLHRVAALTWLDKPFRPTHPHVVVDVWQRDDALRCSLGVSRFPGWHVVRGGHTLQIYQFCVAGAVFCARMCLPPCFVLWPQRPVVGRFSVCCFFYMRCYHVSDHLGFLLAVRTPLAGCGANAGCSILDQVRLVASYPLANASCLTARR